MSNFPDQLDTDIQLPRVDDNIISIGALAINSLRAAMFAVEGTLGILPQGTADSVADFLSVAHNQDGSLKTSALLAAGLIALPITNSQISPTAAIAESKLALNYSTTSLFSLFTSLNASVDVLNGFLSLVGITVIPHEEGTNYRHLLSHIDIDPNSGLVKINPVPGNTSPGTSVINRNITNLDTLFEDINTDLVVHEKADGTSNVTAASGGTIPPANYAHTGSGVWINPNNFTTIPQTNNDVQKLANFIDSSSLLLLGSRTQNLYDNGVSQNSRASSLVADGYGAPLVPPTPCIAFLLGQPTNPISSSPIDSVTDGDDVILFQPASSQLSSFQFDAQFAQVNPGDIITINYGTGSSFQFVIDSIKSIIGAGSPPPRTYAVRINGRNLFASANASARIDRALFNRNKYNVLASARVINNVNTFETLIVANPRGAIALGNNFNPYTFDSSHYNLYLSLLPNGDLSSILNLPPIDVTGNKGASPGEYNLDNIIDITNQALRAPGFNYRLIAFQFQGQFGIAMADAYNNSSFSIIAGTPNTSGIYDQNSNAAFPFNVFDGYNNIDPLGLGSQGSNLASPPPALSYSSISIASNVPTLIFTPLKRQFFYVNGVERDTLNSDPLTINEIVDGYGNGFWPATITSVQTFTNRVEVTYQVNLDLSTSSLRKGKTLVVQPTFSTSDSRYNFRDYGRFIIKNIAFNNCGLSNAFCNITVYDGVHAAGTSPAATSVNIPVNLFFSDDSVAFDAENVADISDGYGVPYKRFFENYINGSGHTSTHERARFQVIGTDISNINFVSVSPKLRGYPTNQDHEILLTISSYNQTTGIFSGFLSRPVVGTNLGPTTTGKKGETVRFYDETGIDYIDFRFNLNDSIVGFTNKTINIRLFKSLQLDGELMYLSSCQVNDSNEELSQLQDTRQFGNIGPDQLSNSSIQLIASACKSSLPNGVINDFGNLSVNPTNILINGGQALISGQVILINQQLISFPIVQEVLFPSFSTMVNTVNWFVCANLRGEIELIANTDFNSSLSATYGSLDHNRIFYVQNPNLTSPTPYAIRATYLSNLLSGFNDVTPLYLAAITITLSGGSYSITGLTVSDIRRFT